MRPPGSLGRKRRLCLLLLRSLRAPDTARCAGAAMCTRPATDQRPHHLEAGLQQAYGPAAAKASACFTSSCLMA